jgi:transcriptional regulator with XRE-family HTH domain
MTKNIDTTTMGGRIKDCRLKVGMTQEALAEKLCTQKSLISMYENDKVDIWLITKVLRKKLMSRCRKC